MLPTNLAKPRRAQHFEAAVHALFLGQNPKNLEFERFVYFYTAIDSCYKLAEELDPPPRGLTHAKRIKWMCDRFSMRAGDFVEVATQFLGVWVSYGHCRPRPVRPLRPTGPTGSARLRTPNRRGELPASHPRSYHPLADSGDRSCFERGGLGCGRSQLRVTVPYQPDRVGQRPPLRRVPAQPQSRAKRKA